MSRHQRGAAHRKVVAMNAIVTWGLRKEFNGAAVDAVDLASPKEASSDSSALTAWIGRESIVRGQATISTRRDASSDIHADSQRPPFG
jgi:hypothetical protein